MRCVCGTAGTSRRRCRDCWARGNDIRLCRLCAFNDDHDLCFNHFHMQHRTRGCGCLNCRKIVDVMNRIERLEELMTRQSKGS